MALTKSKSVEWTCPNCQHVNVSGHAKFVVCWHCERTYENAPIDRVDAKSIKTVLEHRAIAQEDERNHARRKKVMEKSHGVNEQGWVIVGTVSRIVCGSCGAQRYDDGRRCMMCGSRARIEAEGIDGDRL